MKKGIVIVLAMAAAVLIASVEQAAALYQWVDEKGVLHITDYPPPSKAAPEPVAEPAQPAPAPAPPIPPAPPAAAPIAPVTKPAATAAAAPATKPAGTAPGVLTLPAVSPQAAPPVTAAPAPVMPPEPVMPEPSFPQMQEPPAGLIGALVGGFLMVFLAVSVALYVYFALCMYKIGTRLNVEGSWAAWVPVVNSFWPLIGAAGKPVWWFLLFFVPVVNFFVIMYLWAQVIGNLGRNKWLVLLFLLPIVNLVFLGVLAFSKSD
jgi:hypothetical protein